MVEMKDIENLAGISVLIANSSVRLFQSVQVKEMKGIVLQFVKTFGMLSKGSCVEQPNN